MKTFYIYLFALLIVVLLCIASWFFKDQILPESKPMSEASIRRVIKHPKSPLEPRQSADSIRMSVRSIRPSIRPSIKPEINPDFKNNFNDLKKSTDYNLNLSPIIKSPLASPRIISPISSPLKSITFREANPQYLNNFNNSFDLINKNNLERNHFLEKNDFFLNLRKSQNKQKKSADDFEPSKEISNLLKDFILIPKIKMSNIPDLPEGFTPVLNQDDEFLGGVGKTIEVNQSYYDNGVLKSKKIIIAKRYPLESIGEAILRRALEDIYGKVFNRIRPDFLRYHTGKNLELDCWNEDLKIAGEYNGAQHYQRVEKWQKTEEAYLEQIQHDEYKYERMCQLKYYLITVPYTVPHHMIRLYVDYYIPENYVKRMEKEKNRS